MSSRELRYDPADSPRGDLVARAQTVPQMFRPFDSGAEPAYPDSGGDYRKYFAILSRHRWLILSITTACGILALIFTLLQTPMYQASATIQIKREATNLLGVIGLEGVESGRGNEFYQTQYELLKSRALAERVASSLEATEIQGLVNTSVSSWAQIRNMFSARVHAEEPADLTARTRRAVGLIIGGLSINPVRSSSLVRVSFDSADPQVAQRVSNAVAENYVTVNWERTRDATSAARRFLEERLQDLKADLERSEEDLITYAKEQQIITTGQDRTLSSTNLGAANAALIQANDELLKRQMLWEQAQGAESLGLPQILENGTIQGLRAQRAALQADYQDKLLRFKPDFPEMRQLRARRDELDRQITAEVNLVKESLQSHYEASRKSQHSLSQNVEKLKAEVMDFQNRSIQYNILKRAVDKNVTLYDGLLQRYKELGVAGGIDANNLANNVSIVDRARIPGSPYKPTLTMNVAMALAFGFLLGGAAAFAREHFDDSFKTPEELEEALGLPVLGVIPVAGATRGVDHVLCSSRSPVAEAYRSLRGTLQFSTQLGLPKSLLVTSARAGEGKSTTAVALARNFAQLGMKVLLIDADLRKPMLHNYLSLDPNCGLTDYLLGQVDPPEAFQTTDLLYLTVLPSGPVTPDSTELLAGPKMSALLAVAAERFDLVVVDGPPVAGLADAPLLASMTDGTLLLVEANATRRAEVRAGLKRLYLAHAQMVGTVMSKFDARRNGYGDLSGFYGHSDGAAAQIGESRGWLPSRKHLA
jgi:polysaccharide biosynthesis transport protein